MTNRPENDSTRNAREQYRQSSGQFGTQPLDEADPFAVLPDSHSGPDQVQMSPSGNWGALQEAFEAAVRDAYNAGQIDAYARAADLIHEFDTPSSVLVGHTMRHPAGAYAIEVPDECGYEMADKVLGAASDSLRAYATGGFNDNADDYVARIQGRSQSTVVAAPVDAGDPVLDGGDTCPVCGGHGYARRIGPAAGGGDLMAGKCDGCEGMGTLPNTGQTRECDTCSGGGQVRDFLNGHLADTSCGSCGGHGRVRTTLPEQAEVVVPGHGMFGRISRDENFPEEPYAFRIEANRPLTDAEISQAAQLFGYNYRAAISGEPLGWPIRDSDRSFIVAADTTKSSRDDLGVGLDELIDNAPGMFDEGSPVRKTDRAGAGTAGTRLVEGFNDTTLRFDLYADSYTPEDD